MASSSGIVNSLSLPPRNNPTPTKISRAQLTPLQTLLQMGFSRSRAEKALAATGDRGVQIASDWLLAHVNDPTIDQIKTRIFVLYLCPSEGGHLQTQLRTFWDATRTQIARNGAHDSFPHITLTSNFECPIETVPEMIETVKRVARTFAQDFIGTARDWNFEKYTSQNFFGLFVGKNQEILLRSFASAICSELGSRHGIKVSPMSNSYHLTLAYQFAPKHYSGLKDLLSAIDLTSSSSTSSSSNNKDDHQSCGDSWELRLYSYDPRITSDVDVYKVVYPLVPRQEDELQLMSGDLVYVSRDEMNSSTDGWVLGTSWLTGCNGYLPKNYIQRTAESNAWTQHFSLCLTSLECPSKKKDDDDPSLTTSLERLVSERRKASTIDGSTNTTTDRSLVESEQQQQPLEQPELLLSEVEKPRKIFIIRHGERVDFTFGAWIPYCFDSKGNYSRKDLNLPKSVPRRSKGPEGFTRDCPLTNFGETQALLTGEAMRQAGVTIRHVYCSPSLRCVQTCHYILKGLGLSQALKIHIEPGLFEWLAWYQDGLSMPDWMTTDELRNAGFNVETAYKPYISAEELQDVHESCEQYYIRNCFVTQCILQATEEIGGNLLLLGHAATLDACSRQLVGRDARSVQEMLTIVRQVPYCGVTVAAQVIEQSNQQQQQQQYPLKWRLEEPPFPPMTHCSNSRFDWTILTD